MILYSPPASLSRGGTGAGGQVGEDVEFARAHAPRYSLGWRPMVGAIRMPRCDIILDNMGRS